MWFVKALRVWFLSVLVCVVLLAVWVALMQLSRGRTDHLLHNMVNLSMGFGSVFAVVTASIYLPVFCVIRLARDRQPRPAVAAAIGAALAPVAYLAVALHFREAEDPHTLGAWFVYWVSHLPEFAIALVPFAAAGAAFGLLWSRQGPLR